MPTEYAYDMSTPNKCEEEEETFNKKKKKRSEKNKKQKPTYYLNCTHT